MYGVVPAQVGADGPRGAGVVRAGRQRVVRALAVDLADRVDRRQVDDVEAHLGDGVEPLGGGGEGARPPRPALLVVRRPLRAGEQLVPGADQGALAVDVQRERVGRAQQVAQRVVVRAASHVGAGQGGQPRRAPGRRGVGARGRRGLEPAAGRGLGRRARCGALQHQDALGQHQLDVDLRLDLDLRRVPPGGVGVRPRLDPEGPGARLVRRHPCGVAVGLVAAGRLQPGERPGAAARALEHDAGAQRVMTLAEDGRRDLQGLPDDGFHGVAAPLDDGADFGDGNAFDHCSEPTGGRGGVAPSLRPCGRASGRCRLSHRR